jgi:hypothetical protein
MKHIKLYEQFANAINEGTANPDEVALVKDLEKALLSNFSGVEYQMNGKDNKYYDYKNGYVGVTNSYQAPDWSWIDAKRAKILQNCNVSPMYVKASLTYFETISNAEPKAGHGGIGVSGNNYVNNYMAFDLTNPKKTNIAKFFKDWIKFSQKQPINGDLTERILSFWKATKSDYKTINTRDQGYGSQASIHITKSYDKAYVIKDFNIAFGKSEEEMESIIRSHYMFKKDRLDFDWKQGVMIVGGTYTEVWD